MLLNKKGQSMLEYALLLGVVVAAVLIMQTFVKRHVQGGLKEASEKIGETFSASGTSTAQSRNMTVSQVITEEVATNASTTTGIGSFPSAGTVVGTINRGAYSYTNRSGGNTTMEQKSATDSAKREGFRWADYSNNSTANFTSGNINF